MKKFFLLLFSFASLTSEGIKVPDDQLLVLFGSSGYVIYKVLDFANDHGYRYIKILSYEFNGFDHKISGQTPMIVQGGRLFEIHDDYATISFLCFNELPKDIYIIDLEKYRSLLTSVNLDKD
jgi:hypothetical protein